MISVFVHFGKISLRGRVQARAVEPEPNQFWMVEAKNFKIVKPELEIIWILVPQKL